MFKTIPYNKNLKKLNLTNQENLKGQKKSKFPLIKLSSSNEACLISIQKHYTKNQ